MPKVDARKAKAEVLKEVVLAPIDTRGDMEVEEQEPGTSGREDGVLRPKFAPLSAQEQGGSKVEFRRVRLSNTNIVYLSMHQLERQRKVADRKRGGTNKARQDNEEFLPRSRLSSLPFLPLLPFA